MWLVVPRKWLFSLPLLIYAVATLLIADTLRVRYVISDPIYSLLNASAGIAFVFVVVLPLVEGIFRLGLIPIVRAADTRSRIIGQVYWFTAGLITPVVFLVNRLFARHSGTMLLPTLLATAIVSLAIFVIMRHRNISQDSSWLLPGYSLGMTAILVVSSSYGAKVSAAASALAQDTPYCLISYPTRATSMLDMTPLTLVSRGISEYHAELVVETKPTARLYNWSWKNLSFIPIPSDHMHSKDCSEP
jgi:hypothetical protein